jgi:exonuclease III
MNVDLVIVQETKISDEKYTRASFGQDGLASNADTVFQGGIALSYGASHFWIV